MSCKARALALVTFLTGSIVCPMAHAEGLAGTYQVCRTKIDELTWSPEKRNTRIRIEKHDGKYSISFRSDENGTWQADPHGPYAAAPASQFEKLTGVPYLSRKSGLVPEGVKPSKDVPLETLAIPGSAVYLLMPSDWFQRNKETNVSYNSEVIAIFNEMNGSATKPILLCRV